MGEEKLLTVRQLGHCLIKNPLQGSANGPHNGPISTKIPSMLSSSQDSINYVYELIPGLFELQAKLSCSAVPEPTPRQRRFQFRPPCPGSNRLNNKILDRMEI